MCLSVVKDEATLWHRRLGYVHMELINRLSSKNLARELSKNNYEKFFFCKSYQLGKQVRTSFTAKKVVSISSPLQLFHLDLFGPERHASLSGKYYTLVIIDDYSRFI